MSAERLVLIRKFDDWRTPTVIKDIFVPQKAKITPGRLLKSLSGVVAFYMLDFIYFAASSATYSLPKL